MAKLSVKLMGTFRAVLNGDILTDFRSNKVSGLLAYLIVESHRPWARSFLADLFWPDYPEDNAQSNLSNALWNLRSLLGDSDDNKNFIIVQKSTIQFNQRADFWVDVKAFKEIVEKICAQSTTSSTSPELSNLQQSLSKFSNGFMDDFFMNSPPFETWIGKTRQVINQEWIKAFRCLSNIHLEIGELPVALEYTMKWIENEPWDEKAYQQGMKILSELGQRKKAMDLFESYRLRLAQDLGMEPQHETNQLYQQIHQGLEGFFNHDEPHPEIIIGAKKVDPGPVPDNLSKALLETLEPRPFFDRQEELTQLNEWLNKTIDSHGSVSFVTGEPGSGKSYLLTQFANQALKSNPRLILLWGQCNAYTGMGDPYFPFMTMIRMQAGNLESLIPSPIISLEHLERLWHYLPEMLKNLIFLGPDLIRSFVDDFQLFSLAETHPGITSAYLDSVGSILKKSPIKPGRRIALNDQFTKVLGSLSEHHPILLVIDDLQWIDEGSANLLFHLGRQLSRKKIMLLGAFRPAEITVNQDEKPHPMSGIVHEMQALYGDNLINLAYSQGKSFINELLGSEPNAFTPSFHQMLFNHTSGHPLFSIELLRGMQLRNEILKDEHGQWIESNHLDWEKLPARVEAVIAQRFNLLSTKSQKMLIPACVQGNSFSVEILAHVLKIPKMKVFELLNTEVCKQHRLITPHGSQQVGEKTITYFQFRHALFQIYLYNQLNEVDKIYQHGLVGEALENQYKNYLAQFPQMAHTIARHFEFAQNPEKALQYYKLAGDYAMRLTAHQEAIRHYYHALSLLEVIPPSSKRDSIELDLRLSLGPPITSLKGWGAPELEKAYDRAQILIEGIDDSSKLVPTLWLLGTFRLGRSEHSEVDRLVSRLYKLAQNSNDPALIAIANLQVSPLYQGRLIEARKILKRCVADVDIKLQKQVAQKFGMAPDLVAACYLYNCLWLMGYPEQSDLMNQNAIDLAKKVNHPMTTCYVTGRACWFAMVRDNPEDLKFLSDQLLEVSIKHEFKNFELAALFFKQWLNLQEKNSHLNTIEAMQKILDDYSVTKTILNRTVFLVYFSKACKIAGQQKQGLDTINKCIALGEETGELWFQAEAWRTKGELLFSQSDQAVDEENRSAVLDCFKRAYQIAQDQNAKMWELRAAMSLAKFYTAEGQSEAGRKILQETYDWFTEGFETKELKQAKSLLDSLSSN